MKKDFDEEEKPSANTRIKFKLTESYNPNYDAAQESYDCGYDRMVYELCRDLEALGIDVYLTLRQDECDYTHSEVFLNIEYDTEKLKQKKTRNAGPKIEKVWSGSPLYDLTCLEAKAWFDSHDEWDGIAALGHVSRSTYYRRKKAIKELAQQSPSKKYRDVF